MGWVGWSIPERIASWFRRCMVGTIMFEHEVRQLMVGKTIVNVQETLSKDGDRLHIFLGDGHVVEVTAVTKETGARLQLEAS